MNNPRCSKLLFAASSIFFCHDDDMIMVAIIHICNSILFLYFISCLSDNDFVFFSLSLGQ